MIVKKYYVYPWFTKTGDLHDPLLVCYLRCLGKSLKQGQAILILQIVTVKYS